MKYSRYYNHELGNSDIYSRSSILGMTLQEMLDNEKPLAYQYNTIGIPDEEELKSSKNTYQYTGTDGKQRWRAGVAPQPQLQPQPQPIQHTLKSTDDLLEEERQRRAELASQQTAQQPMEIPTQELTQPMEEEIVPESLNSTDDKFDWEGLGNLVSKIKNRKKNAAESNSAIIDAIEEFPDMGGSVIKEVIENKDSGGLIPDAIATTMRQDPMCKKLTKDLSNPNLESESAAQEAAENAKNEEKLNKVYELTPPKPEATSPKVLEAYISESPNLLERIKGRIGAFQKLGFNKEDGKDLKGEFQGFLRDHSKLYRNYEGLSPMEAFQKAASKFPIPLSAREYYGIASELNDDGKPSKKSLKKNDFYKLSDIHNEETRKLIEKNMIQNMNLDPNDPASYEKIKDVDIVVPKQNTNLNRIVKNSPELAEFIYNNYENMKTSGKRVDSSLKYARPSQDNGSDFLDKLNRYGVIKKSDVSARMNSDGSISIITPDFYDFGHMDPEKETKWYNRSIAYANNRAESQQKKGQLKPYSLVDMVTLTSAEIEALLEQERQRRKNK